MFNVVVSGKLTKDPEIMELENGTIICNFVISNYDYHREKTNFVRCTAYGKVAENLKKNQAKGDSLVVSGKGRLEEDEYKGKRIYYFSVTVNEIVYLKPSQEKKDDLNDQFEEVTEI